MEGPTKRHMSYGIQPSSAHSYKYAELSTLGMKIRKAVADGHSFGGSHTYNAQFFAGYSKFDEPQDPIHDNNYNRFFSSGIQRPQRVALPPNMDSPPALTSDGSTFQSGSNVSEWDAPSVATTTLPQKPSLKRKMSDSGDVQVQHDSPQQQHQHSFFPSYDQFTAQNGQLSFNEEF